MNRLRHNENAKLLIIGFGNSSRRDDGIGPIIVDKLRGSLGDADEVDMISVRQLGPELTEDLERSSGVIFIDADCRELPGGVSWSRIRPAACMLNSIHGLTAGELIGLTELLYNQSPPAWMVSVQGRDFGFGDGLSGEAAGYADLAAVEIAGIVKSLIPFNFSRTFMRGFSCKE